MINYIRKRLQVFVTNLRKVNKWSSLPLHRTSTALHHVQIPRRVLKTGKEERRAGDGEQNGKNDKKQQRRLAAFRRKNGRTPLRGKVAVQRGGHHLVACKDKNYFCTLPMKIISNNSKIEYSYVQKI